MSIDNQKASVMKTNGDAEKPVASAKTEMPTDGLGVYGPVISSYHVGDFFGLIGLVLTILTFWQAKAAKNAAKEAASAAIENRDRVELVTRLAELAAKLRVIRDVYRAGDLESVETTRDHAVAILIEIQGANKDTDILNLMQEINEFLREILPDLDRVKDDVKRGRIRADLVHRTNVYTDKVEFFRIGRMKNGS